MITTLNLSVFLLDFLKPLAEEAGISITEFVLICLRRKIRKMCSARYRHLCRAVEYQPKGGRYVRVHVGFDWDEYDCNLLCRFARKFSVSLLAAMAVHEFYQEVYNELTGVIKKDNYQSFIPSIYKLMLTKTDKKKTIVSKYLIELKTPNPN